MDNTTTMGNTTADSLSELFATRDRVPVEDTRPESAKEEVKHVPPANSQEVAQGLKNSPNNISETAKPHPFSKAIKIANGELENLRKYSDDAALDDKIKAFDYFLTLASPKELEETLEELTKLEAEPLKLAKRMIGIGKRYYEESYKDIITAGGLHGFLSAKNNQITKLQQTITDLKKKLAQHEDFDPPRYRINELVDADTPTVARDSISELFHERDRAKPRYSKE